MKYNKKTIPALCMSLALGASAITGCTLITRNDARFYGAVAAEIVFLDGSKVEITRRELRTAFVNYGFNQTTQGSSETEAYQQALDFLISQKLAIKDAETKSRAANPDDAILTAKEKEYLFETTFELMLDNISSFLNVTDSSGDEETSETQITRNTFTPQAELRYDEEKEQFTVVLPDSAKKDIDAHEYWDNGNDAETNAGKEKIYNLLQNYISGDKPLKDAYMKYIDAVKQSEKGLKLSTDNKSVFIREIERVYGVNYDSFMVGKYEDFIGGTPDNNLIINEILKAYQNSVRNDYAAYFEKDQTDAIKEKSGDIYYFNEDIDWFYVTHILVEFSEEEKAELTRLNNEIENLKANKESSEKSVSDCERKIDDLYNNLMGKVRARSETDPTVYDYKKDGDKFVTENVNTIYSKVKSAVDGKTTPKEKIKQFDDLIYVYNQDPGIMNATYNYIVGVDYKKQTIDEENPENNRNYTVYSNWVSEFNDAAVSLYDNGAGQVGDLFEGGEYNGLIRSSYGVHIMMYAGKAGNIFNNINTKFTVQTSDILALSQTCLNQATDKTYFDLMYEKIAPTSSSIFQNLDQDRLEDTTKNITNYPQNY